MTLRAKRVRWTPLAAVIVTGSSLVSAKANSITGPTSSEPPYVVRSQPGVVTHSILTVGDSVNYKQDGVTPYRMVGIPDGLGAFDNNDGTFTVLMNHEIPGGGVVRDHGFNGAFVSRWIIAKGSLAALHGEDLIKHAFRWDSASASYLPATNAYARFCSADLAPLSAFFNSATGNGFNGRIYLNGEETGSEGRAVAHFMNGNSYQLPALGRMSWENTVAHPNAGDQTVVVGLDDSGGGQVYVYVGTKVSSGHDVNKAGLAGGKLYGIKVSGYPDEIAATGIPSGTAFTGFDLGNVTNLTGAQINSNSVAAAVTGFLRPEDGCWDPSNLNDFYFVTTDNFNGRSRLWRLSFLNPATPAMGGTIDMLLDGTEGQKMMDNMTVTHRGSVFVQEDVGGNAHLGRILRYSIARDTLEEVAIHDSDRFLAGGSEFLTQDEESSGIIPLGDILGEGWYLLDVQAHYNPGDVELVEGGQLLALHFPPGREK
jgi:hypothetical protein